MGFPIAGLAIGAGAGLLNSIFGGGGPQDYLNDESRQYIMDHMRQYGPQAAEDLLRRQGAFAGPLTERPTGQGVMDWMNPYAEQARGRLEAGLERANALGFRQISQRAAAAGTRSGSARGQVAAGEMLGRNTDAYLDALSNLDLNLYGQAQSGYLNAMPYINQHLQEPLLRHQAAMGAYQFGLGPREAYANPRAGEKDQGFFGRFASGFAGALPFMGAFGGRAGVIPPMVNPPQGIAPVPGPNLTPSPLPAPPKINLPSIVPPGTFGSFPAGTWSEHWG